MVKNTIHTFQKMNKDLSESKSPVSFYYDAHNLRFITNDQITTGAFAFEKGNSKVLSIPKPIINASTTSIDYTTTLGLKKLIYKPDITIQPRNEIEREYYISNNTYKTSGVQIIIGHAIVRDNIILFTTDSNGFDCIWKVDDENYNIELLYLRNLNFNIANPIQALGNYENKIINKVYWVDGKNQLRFINIEHSILNGDLENLIDFPKDSINSVSGFNLSQPIITDVVAGGTHTSGKIQYAYNLFRINNSQTKLSPLSELVSLDKGENLGGGEINEVVGSVPIIEIDNIDTHYTHIRIYAIKYTSYNTQPSINLIYERELNGDTNITYYDSGSIIQALSLEEFLFLGSDIIIPKHISTKKNIMFMANYEEKNFDIDLDWRAYSFNNAGVSKIYTRIRPDDTNTLTGDFITVPITYIVPKKFDSINLFYDVYKYQKDGITLGGEGKYIKYELSKTSINNNRKFFKDDEIYRIGIQFYNRRGQISLPKWIADFKAPSGNLEENFNILDVTLKDEFYIWLNNTSNFQTEDDKPIGFRILRADRQLRDRTIISSGLLSTMMVNDKRSEGHNNIEYKKERSKITPKLPNILVRTFQDLMPLRSSEHLKQMDIDSGLDNNYQTEIQYNGGAVFSNTWQYNSMLQMYSPEILFNNGINYTNDLTLSIKGGLKNSYNAYWGQEKDIGAGGSPITEGKVFFDISPHYTDNKITIRGNVNNLLDEGLIAHPGGSNPNVAAWDQYYRVFGKYISTTVDTPDYQLISFTNQFNPAPVGLANIRFNSNKTGIRVTLNDDTSSILFKRYKAVVTYTITPNPGYETVEYSAAIRYAANINAPSIESFTNQIGIQTISQTVSYDFISGLLSPAQQTYNFFLYIKAESGPFQGTIDVNVLYEEREGAPNYNTVTFSLERESIENPINVNSSGPQTEGPGFIPSVNSNSTEIYGIPELTERGQDFKAYNNDAVYTYSNSLQSFLSNGNDDYDDGGTSGRSIVSINSYGARTTTLVTGSDNPEIEHWQRPTNESLKSLSGIEDNNIALYGELIKSRLDIYLGNIYGGISYEDKKRTNYIEIGDYTTIGINHVKIYSPGDTYVGNFRFERISRTDVDILDQTVQQYTEIVEFTVETTLELKNRNDISISKWDAKFQPTYPEYHKYNQVYSQQSNLLLRRDVDYKFKRVEGFDTNVIATKTKVPGEIVDSWTDLLVNEILSLDGKYGPINNLISYRDELFTFQDRGIARLSILPRVQVQASDGLSLELGSGSVLNEYAYLTTNSGSINKWGIMPTEIGIYYLDALNKSFNLIGNDFTGLSDIEGFHKYFLDNIDIDSIRTDNPLLFKGVSMGWDKITNDIYLSIFNGSKKITLSYNMAQKGFSSFYDYNAAIYIFTKGKTLTLNPYNQSELYQNFIGDYNKFYTFPSKSSIDFIVNPEPHIECTFNNLEYKSEAFNNLNQEVNYTWERIRAYNEFQDSNLVALQQRDNIRKLNRKWRLNIPRDKNKVNRIRNTWSILHLESNNLNNYKYRNHDIIIYYNPNYKLIQ